MVHAARIKSRLAKSERPKIYNLATFVRENQGYFLLVLRIGKQNVR